MDIQTIDQAYSQLQGQAQQSAQALQTLGNKMQAAAQNGDMQAREWMLDLRELALAFQAEQQQVASLLQNLHNAVANQAQNYNQNSAQGGFMPQQPQGFVPQQPQQAAPGQQGGFFSNFMNSGFARSLEMGAGFGIGDDLIKEIF